MRRQQLGNGPEQCEAQSSVERASRCDDDELEAQGQRAVFTRLPRRRQVARARRCRDVVPELSFTVNPNRRVRRSLTPRASSPRFRASPPRPPPPSPARNRAACSPTTPVRCRSNRARRSVVSPVIPRRSADDRLYARYRHADVLGQPVCRDAERLMNSCRRCSPGSIGGRSRMRVTLDGDRRSRLAPHRPRFKQGRCATSPRLAGSEGCRCRPPCGGRVWTYIKGVL
jgi:hypothetical protein